MTKPRFTILLAALLALHPADANALFGFNPCRTCRAFLIICCPKPCPVADRAHRANERRIRATNTVIEDVLVETTRTVIELHNTIGHHRLPRNVAPPTRAPRQPAGDSRFAASDDIGPSIPSAPSPSVVLDHLQPRPASTEGQAFESLQNNAILDAAQAHQTLTWALARAEETAAAADDPIAHAQDIRSMLQRNLQMQAALAQIRAAIDAARSYRTRLEVQRHAQQPLTLPPRNTLPPTIPR